MKKPLAALLEDPPREDSGDFTQEEAAGAVPTKNSDDLVSKIMRQVLGSRVSKFSIRSHELRRRGDHLYCRVRLGAHNEPDKVLVFQIDWVEP